MLIFRKSQAIVNARSSSCKNFNVAHYSKNIKGISAKLVILAQHNKLHLRDKGHNSECYISGVMPLFN